MLDNTGGDVQSVFGRATRATSDLPRVCRLATVNADVTATRGAAGAHARAAQGASAASAIGTTLRARHLAGLPYTWLTDDVLISCNPQRPLAELHGHSQIALHASLPSEATASPAEPHIFAVAEAAVRKALNGEPTCICMLGESGAGKTEACKLALLHVLHRSGEISGLGGGGPDEPLRRALLMCRPVLEALTRKLA